MDGRPSSVIQGSFAGPWAGLRAATSSGDRGGRCAGRAWLVPRSAVARDFERAGHPLPGPLRREMESLFRADFGDVRFREGTSASTIGARALTGGPSIVFAPGQFAPSSAEGRRLLGRELSHVVQQRSGRAINPYGRGLALLRDVGMEAEAERMGARVAASHAAPPAAGPGMASPADLVERSKGRMFEDRLGRWTSGGPASTGARGVTLPEVVYHGTGAVLDGYPSGQSNWFTWDFEEAKAYSRSIPGGSLVYRYGVGNRSDRDLLILRHRGEFARSLDRLKIEQSKPRVDGWIELGPSASLMLARPPDYLEFAAVMGLVPGPDGASASWTGWRASVDQIEADAGGRCRFPRGGRGPGNRGAHDRLLAQQVARSLTLAPARRPAGHPATRLTTPWGNRP